MAGGQRNKNKDSTSTDRASRGKNRDNNQVVDMLTAGAAAEMDGQELSLRQKFTSIKQTCSAELSDFLSCVMDTVENLQAENKRLTQNSEVQDGRVDRLEVKNAQLKEKLVQLEERQMQKNVLITNIPESANEDCVEVAKQFFRNKLAITQNIDLDTAHRTGARIPGKSRFLIAAFVRRTERHLVLSRGRMLAGSNIRMLSQYPDEMRTSREMLFDQRKRLLEEDSEANIRVQGERLIKKDAQGREEVLVDAKKERNKVYDRDANVRDVVPELRPLSGRVVEIEGGAFQAHFVPISHLSQLRSAMAAVCAENGCGRATHNMFALRLGAAEGREDDGERGSSRVIMDAMKARGITDGICIVSRFFGGTHLGRRRFDIIKEEAELILDIYKSKRY